jgi:phosphopantothenoylcysteine decarboxylase / phosphopantothenate---cysteine ligase
MMSKMLNNKKILLGVTGSIAAYKAAYLVRLLVKQNNDVKVLMTESSKDFITPLTLSTLSKKPVNLSFFDAQSGMWTSHVDLGEWADLFLIAPATANTIAKMAAGVCDNLLLATYLSASCPVFIAPAMDRNMYMHPATQTNIQLLEKRGSIIIPAVFGELASGLTGEGKMAEPDDILKQVAIHF